MKRYFSSFAGFLLTLLLVSCNDNNDKKLPNSSSSLSSSSSSVSSAASVSSLASSSSSSSVVTSSSSSATSTMSSSSVSSVSSSSTSSASSSAASTVTLNGTAAIGAPITNGTVTAKCANGSGFTQAVTTNAQGAYSGSLAANSFPCALQISGGTPAVTLHSYALAAGTVNITPLTDLLIANASTLLPADWFNSSSWQILEAQLTAAQNNLKASLSTGGYTIPQGTFDPFKITFQIGDSWDQLLDQLQAALVASNSTYANLLTLVKDGSLNSLPPKKAAGNGSGTGNASSCFNPNVVAQGTKILLNYKTTDAETSSVTNIATSIEVKGTTTFNGKSATESVSQTQTTGPAASTSTTKSYFTANNSAKSITYHGSIVDVSAPVSASSTLTINPGMTEQFNLSAGESYTQTYAITTATQVMGFPVSTVTDFVNKLTFKGVETITVPAGTFKACRIETDSKTTVLGNSVSTISTSWISVDSGISVRTEASGDVSELVSGSINGTAIK